jgi:heptaprenyl diphosphate synthase
MLTPPPGKTEDCKRRLQSRWLHSRRLHNRLALLGSLCLFLSAIEYLIPKPLPFMRIGLANLPLLLALDILGPGEFFLLALLKVLGQGIIGGTLFSYVFLFSLAGTCASAALMYLLRKWLGKKHLGFAGLGCAGAMASNGVQLVLARYLIFGASLRYLIPPFLASGFITGMALGLICEYFCRRSRWYAAAQAEMAVTAHKEEAIAETVRAETAAVPKRQSCRQDIFNADELFVAGLLMALIFLLSRSLPGRVVQFLFFCLLAVLLGKKINPFAAFIFMAGIVFFNLLAPYGKVLAIFGPLRVTQGSLFAGLEKAVSLEGLLMLSRACIKSDLRLPGTIGSLLGESLRILELMREKRGMIRRGHIIAGIDQLMPEMEAVNVNEPENAPHRKPQRSGKSIVLLCVIVLLTAVMGFGPYLLI